MKQWVGLRPGRPRVRLEAEVRDSQDDVLVSCSVNGNIKMFYRKSHVVISKLVNCFVSFSFFRSFIITGTAEVV